MIGRLFIITLLCLCFTTPILGAGNITIVGTTNDEFDKVTAKHITADSLYSISTVRIDGTLITAATKNRTRVALKDSTGAYLFYQPFIWFGGVWKATTNYGFGHNALQSNTGERSNGLGTSALESNTGSYSNGFGHAALKGNTGLHSNGFGAYALFQNVGIYSNGFGYAALFNNDGTYSNGFGDSALYDNTGNYSNGFGYSALQTNTGIYSNGFGHAALQNNIGVNSAGFGHNALRSNTGDYTNSFGAYSSRNNTGDHATGYGDSTLQNNDGDYNTAIGSRAFNTFTEDSGSAKTFVDANVTAVDDYIYIVAHGFGAVGTYVNLKASTAGVLPTGLAAGVSQFKVIHADTVEYLSASITGASGGGTHTLTPQTVYTNSTAVGYNAEPTASNQIMLGNVNVIEVYINGHLKLPLNASFPDTTGYSGGEMWLSAIGDSIYIYKSDHTMAYK